MDLYDLKKTLESLYYTHCIRQGKLPLPDLVYYHWDKKRIAKSLISTEDRGTELQNKERSPRKEKKKKKKPK